MSIRQITLRISLWLAIGAATAPFLCASPILDPAAPNVFAMYGISSIPDFTGTFPSGYYLNGMAISGSNMLISIGTAVNNLTQTIWSMPLIRTNGHITGFGSASLFATVATGTTQGNPLGGGIVTITGGILYTTSTSSYFGQYLGSPTNTNTLTNIQGVVNAVGGMNYIPTGQTGAGQIKVDSTVTGTWYTLNLTGTPGAYVYQGSTSYNVNVPALSFAYLLPDNAFTSASVAIGNGANIDVYQLDSAGNPCNTVGCAPVVHLADAVDAPIGYGVVRDPLTGDILYNTLDNGIYVLSSDLGEVPEPATFAFALGGIALLALRALRR